MLYEHVLLLFSRFLIFALCLAASFKLKKLDCYLYVIFADACCELPIFTFLTGSMKYVFFTGLNLQGLWKGSRLGSRNYAQVTQRKARLLVLN
jgi:hypothetical protein